MCGRFSETSHSTKIAKAFRVDPRVIPPKQNRFNITPSQPVLTLMNDFGKKRFDYLNWGLVPSWAKDPSLGAGMINARAETIFEKPSFKSLVKNSRCLIVADGFYEWKKIGSKKQPYFIQLKSRETFGFAGLYTSWTSRDGSEIHSCTIVTTTPNEQMVTIHQRMPVILTGVKAECWLDKNETSSTQIKDLLQPAANDLLEIYPVSTYVNSPANDDVRCQEKVFDVPSPAELFS